MKIREVVQRRLRVDRDGVSVAADLNAVVAANVDRRTVDESPGGRDPRDPELKGATPTRERR